MPLNENKTEGPAEVITFLGIEIDSINMELRLPQEKLSELLNLLKKWRGMKSCRKRDLQSIAGSLNHACMAVRAGRSFKRRLHDLIASVEKDDRRVRLNVEARADLDWWFQFGLGWNGRALMQKGLGEMQPDHKLVSDASGSWGCGRVEREMVPAELGDGCQRVEHNAQGDAANCDCSNSVGRTMGRLLGVGMV